MERSKNRVEDEPVLFHWGFVIETKGNLKINRDKTRAHFKLSGLGDSFRFGFYKFNGLVLLQDDQG